MSLRFLLTVTTLLVSLIHVQLTPLSGSTQVQIQNQTNTTLNAPLVSGSTQVQTENQTFIIPNQSQEETTNAQPDNTDIKKCKNVTYYPIKKIHFKRMMGKWFSLNPVTKKQCETCQYTEKTDGTFIKVCKVLVSDSMAKKLRAEQKAAEIRNNSKGFFKVKNIVANRYSIIGTDYDTYAVLYYCNNGFPSVKLRCRQNNPSQITWDRIFDVLENNTISSDAINTPSNNCF